MQVETWWVGANVLRLPGDRDAKIMLNKNKLSYMDFFLLYCRLLHT